MRELVESGALGRLTYIYSNRLSFGKVRTEEDVVWSFAPHDISMILALSGDQVSSVSVEASRVWQIGIADTATLHLDFYSAEGSCFCIVAASRQGAKASCRGRICDGGF